MKATVCSSGDTDFFDIVAKVLQEDTLAPYLFLFCQDYLLQTFIDQIKENDFTLKEARIRWYPAETMRDVNYGDDLTLLANKPAQESRASCKKH